jgi:DNA modification methylase
MRPKRGSREDDERVLLALHLVKNEGWTCRAAGEVWMDIQQGNVLNRMKGANDEKHVCPLQLDVIERCLRLYSKPGDVVMDPFNGIGSTGYQAVKMFRRYIGFELKPEYAKQADKNMKEAEASVGDLFSGAA